MGGEWIVIKTIIMADVQFENIANFRQAGGIGIRNKYGKRLRDDLLYRSARPDFMTTKDCTSLLQLGIKSFVDLRGKRNYMKKNAPRPLESLYIPCTIQRNKTIELSDCSSQQAIGRLYLLNFYTLQLLHHIFSSVNFAFRWFSILVLVPIDMIFGTHLVAKFFGRLVVRHQSMVSQYMDYIQYSSSVIAKVFRLLVNSENLPLVLHCAYGKDRTGLIVALFLACLDFEDDIIIQDYCKSEEGLYKMRDEMYYELVQDMGLSEHNCYATPQVISATLNEIRSRYSSVSKYLESIGFSVDEQLRLKSIFLVD